MPDYGQLSKRPLDEMIAGARVEVAAYKRDPRDFVLWKPSKPGEPAWPSPAGIEAPGRPGWHIECSAMSWKHLGETFDIHGGGIDLVFPHHENEIAQSRCAFHTPVMANYWMHNGFLQVEGEKMAKCARQFRDDPRVADRIGRAKRVRFAMLQTHYRQPINWTAQAATKPKERSIIGTRLTDDVTPDYCAPTCSTHLRRSQYAEGVGALHELRREAAKGRRACGCCLKASAEIAWLVARRQKPHGGMSGRRGSQHDETKIETY